MTENERRKNEILIEFYETGRIDKLYFGIESKSKANPIKAFIKKYLYKNFLDFDNDLINDCYNEGFKYLFEKSADRIIEIYNTSPRKLQATLCRIIIWKCFTPGREGNPKGAIAKNLQFTSTFFSDNFSINHIEKKDESDTENSNQELIIYDEDIDGFENEYGFTVEQLIAELTPEETELFYQLADRTNKKKGKPTAERVAEKEAFKQRIRDIKEILEKKSNE